MKKISLLISVLFASASMASAQSSITPDVLKQLQQKQPVQASDKAIRNAMAHASIATLATDANALTMMDTHFTYRVPNKGITDQKSSGRCWLFTGMNVLRSKAINTYSLKGLELSQNYLFFYDQLEKANLFLQGVIDTRKQPMDDRLVDWLFSNPLSDGGTFCGVADLVKKYGVVPKEAMPETYQSNSTSEISRLLKLKLREFGLELREKGNNTRTRQSDGMINEGLEKRKVEMLSEIYRILTLAYGIPPTEFVYEQRDAKDQVVASDTYTPQSFYAKYWGDEDLYDNYIMVMNDPLREYYKTYQIEFDRHTYDGHDWVYLNLPVEEIKPMAVASIKDSTAMYFSCDVGKFLNRKDGTLRLDNFDYECLLGTTFGMNKSQRVQTHASGSSHAMTLVAVDVDTTATDLKCKKWMVENSWGATSGYQGHLIMTDEWFDNYMFRLVVNRKYVEEKYLKMAKQKPTLLPAWDPMFLPEE
ncbi:MAG: C1 family peptidase [Bacteroidales bacterium]|nr:C1 family peptidase [Bacteroidales bacterium]